MKILFLIPNLTAGGIQTQVFYLSNYLKNTASHDVKIIGFMSKDKNYTNKLDDLKIQWEYKPNLGKLIWGYENLNPVIKLISWLRLYLFLIKQGSVVLMPYTKHLDTFFNAIVRFSMVKTTFSFERGGHLQPKRQSESFINRLSKKSNPVYVANSEHGKTAIHLIKGIELDQIRVIRNGIDFLGFSQHKNKSQKPLQVTMVANFFPEKEHLFVLDAWQRVEKSTSFDLKLNLVGLGGGSMCEENFNLAQLRTQELGLKNVKFIGNQSNVINILNTTHIGLLATKSEGCPNAILEYMAAGLPIIASDIPGIREIVSEENKAWLFQRENLDDFVKKLITLAESSEIRDSLAASNYEHVRKAFGIEKMGEQYAKILDEIE